MQEAIRAKQKMHGRMACGRPLVVRLASDKYPVDGSPNPSKTAQGSRSSLSSGGGGGGGQTSRTAKIAAIKNKLKAIDEESHKTSKKQKQTDESCTSVHENPPERM